MCLIYFNELEEGTTSFSKFQVDKYILIEENIL